MVVLTLLLATLFSPTDSLLIKVSEFSKQENYFLGSSFLISKTKVLTSAHILFIKDKMVFNKNVKVYCLGEELSVKIKKVNRTQDIALLELNKECNQTPLQIADKNPEYTEKVITVAGPDGRIGLATAGIVAGYQVDKDGSWLISDTSIFFGSSGGPLMNEFHRVVGLASRIIGFSQFSKDKDNKLEVITNSYSLWVPVSEIRKFLDN